MLPTGGQGRWGGRNPAAAAASSSHLHTPLLTHTTPLYYPQIIKSYLTCVNGVIIRGLLAWGEGDGGGKVSANAGDDVTSLVLMSPSTNQGRVVRGGSDRGGTKWRRLPGGGECVH